MSKIILSPLGRVIELDSNLISISYEFDDNALLIIVEIFSLLRQINNKPFV